MSIYTGLDGVLGEQVASNRGWGDFCQWVAGPDSGDYPELAHLCEYGWTEELAAIDKELHQVLHESSLTTDLYGIASTLLGVVAGRSDATVLTIGDGLGPDNDDSTTDTAPAQPAPAGPTAAKALAGYGAPSIRWQP